MAGVRLSKPNVAVFDKAHLPGMRRALRNCGFPLQERNPGNGMGISVIKQWEGAVSVVKGDKAFCETKIWESLGDARVSFSSLVSMGRGGNMLVDALPQTRFERLKKRGRIGDPQTFEEFTKQERNEITLFRAKETFEYAEDKLDNSGTLDNLHKNIEAFMIRHKLD